MLKNLPLSKILLSLAAVSVLAVAAVGGTFANFTATPTAIRLGHDHEYRNSRGCVLAGRLHDR